MRVRFCLVFFSLILMRNFWRKIMRAFQWIQWLSMRWVLVENKGDKWRKTKSAGINHLSVCKISRASGVWLPIYILNIVFRIFNINLVWCIDYVIWTMNWMVHFIFLLFLHLEFFSLFFFSTFDEFCAYFLRRDIRYNNFSPKVW